MYKKYVSPLTGAECAVRLEDGAFIYPTYKDHPDWVAYLAWVAEGNTPEEWSPNGDQ
jgi:hypothetical protein